MFFGTSAFAVPPLHAFAAATDCRLVVTQPDRPAGRGQQLRETPVKQAARELGIPTIEPERMRDALPALAAEKFDLFAVASYGKIVPQAILDLPRLGALNVHPSLLPLYRGATPLQSQIRDGVTESGVTIILMDAGMDTGDIVVQERSNIGESETYGELHDRFALLGAALLERAVEGVCSERAERIPQRALPAVERAAATATRPLTKADLEVDMQWPADRIYNHLRALIPDPLGRIALTDGVAKVLEARLVGPLTAQSLEGARSLGDGWLALPSQPSALCCVRPDGVVLVTRLTPPNRKPMSASEYLRSHLQPSPLKARS